jgi:ribonuclease P protein component
MALLRLKKRLDFLRVAQLKRTTKTTTMLVQCGYSPDTNHLEGVLRVGFTASRRVGNAVKRNRAKRRLRSLADQYLKTYFAEVFESGNRPSLDFVFIAIPATVDADFQQLQRDFFKSVNLCLDQIRRQHLKSTNK